jgi:fatty acyl-CoA reductase
VAASVDFNEFLKDSLRINYFGCLQMLQLASECRRLEIHLHVSTAYVNCIKKGYVEEKIFMRSEDIQEKVDGIMAMPDEEVREKTNKLIENFPNTYTFTKSLAEMRLQQMRGSVPVVIFRPSIITASY